MALVLTVGGVDITGYVDVGSILVEEVASQDVARVAVLRFTAEDASGTIDVAPEDAVSLVDGETTYYSGTVKDVVDRNRGVTRVWRAACTDNNVLLEETAIETYTIDTYDDDDVEIAAIFAAYRDDIDASTYVNQLDTTMPELVLDAHTLREALDAICAHTGGRYYVDESLNLHYFTAESNNAAFGLSDSPDGEATFGYGGFERSRSSARKAARFWVQGQGVSGWVTGNSYSAGDPEGVSRDNRITTTAGRDTRGESLLERFEAERVTYELETRKEGLQAGMDVNVVNTLQSIDAAFTIRKLQWRFLDTAGSLRNYHLWLNDEPASTAKRMYSLGQAMATLQQGMIQVDESVFDANAPAAPTFTAGNLTTGVELDADGHQIVYIRATWGLVNDADLDHYEVQLADNTPFNWAMGRMVQTGDTREAQWNGLKGNISYYARVRSVDWVGNYSAWSPASPGYLAVTSSKDGSAPATPTGLAAAGARTLIGVSWDTNSEADLAQYELQRAPDSDGSPGEWATIATVRTTFYVDEEHSEAAIAAGTTYHYQVRAVDSSGNNSDYAASVSASLSAIGSDTIAAGAIITAKLAAGAVTAGKITADTITANEIAAGTITATEMTVSTLSAITADMGTLTAGEIRVGAGTVGVDFTGFRIMSTYLGGYNDDTLQAGIRSSDGKFIAGGGACGADANGFWVRELTGISAPESSPQRTYQLVADDDITTMRGAFYYKSGLGTILLSGSGSTSLASLMIMADGFYWNDSILHLNESGNTKMDKGLTINQAAYDTEIIALKSSDVAHGATDFTETDTYGYMAKASGAAGGLTVRGVRDSGAYKALELAGILATNINTDKTTSAQAIVEVLGVQTSGASIANTVADGNVLAVKTYRGGAYVALFIVDEDGDIYYDGSAASYDAEDDLALVRELSDILAEPRGRTRPERGRSEVLGIVHRDDNGAMLSSKREGAVVRGALLQLAARVQVIEERLTM